MDAGFVKAQSDNLPKVDAFMMREYFASHPNFTSAEMKGVKASRSQRESYGDSAIGYVQVKREGDICTVKARITPEHNVRQKSYVVIATCNETEETVLSVQCEDCAAHLGGCKHAIAFLAWLHRRSEDQPSTSIDCYWKKSKLASVGTSLKYIKAKDIGNAKPVTNPSNTDNFLLVLIGNNSQMVNNKKTQLTQYYMEPSTTEKLSIHHLASTIKTKPASADDFLCHCKNFMMPKSCEEAELATQEQNDCPLWHELRYARITASKAHEAAHCKTFNGALTESIMGARKLRDTDAMRRGRLLEKEVVKEVQKLKNIKINKCGLKLNPNYPILGASPDGETDLYSIEVKCPSSEKALSRYISPLNKLTPKYMAQVQLQMHFSKKTKALFCVAHSDFETTRKVNIIEVQYDSEFCEGLLEKCMLFWNNAIFPLLFQ